MPITDLTSGIDVSRWQGPIDWPAVAAAGHTFAVIRATIGSIYKDPRAFENVAGALSAGLLTTVYHVVRWDVSAREQYNNLRSMTDAMPPLQLPIVLDVELPTPAGCTPSHLATLQHTRELMELIPGQVNLYTGAWWWDPAISCSDSRWALPADLWIASYSTAPRLPKKPWRKWTFWQYTSSGTCAGIAGAVDLNYFAGDVAALKTYATHQTGADCTPPEPTTHTITVTGHNVQIVVT